jgi:hypothetical protein
MRVNSLFRGTLTTWLTAVTVIVVSLGTAHGQTSGFGRITGVVADPQGMPLMGATVQIIGPMLNGVPGGAQLIEKILTDAHGRFMAERLLPGRYSLQVTSATRLPIFRKGILVSVGQSVEQSFVLADILAPIRLQVPTGNVTTWGDDWKWVLRTSAATRPILRFQQEPKGKSKKKGTRPALPESERLIAVNSGAHRGQALSSDPGMGSIVAYQRSLSENSDLLVAGSLATGNQVTSVATVLRREFARDNPQELSLAVHQLNAADSFALGAGPRAGESGSAQAISSSYSQTRRVLRQLIVTAGVDVDYLYAGQSTASARPYVKAEYELNPTSSVVIRHGSARIDGSQSLLDRVDALGAFPRITLQGYQPRLERLIHSEAAYTRQVGRSTRVEAAVYHDQFQNAALWGFGNQAALAGLSGNYFANPAADGVTLYAGHYASSGVRTALVHKLGNSTEVSVLYAMGDALMADARGAPVNDPVHALQSSLRTRQTQSVGGRVSTRIPRSRTIVTTSYLYIPANRLSSVDPVGQANLQVQPYLGVQIRQPLPSLAFLPARIEATADFRNLLSQGYVPVRGSGEDSLLITPAYRCIRGGFSVQF